MAELRSVQAKRQILRFLQDSNLHPGDKLPTYGEMRQMFGFGSATLMTAIRQLQSDGLLLVQDKVGVFLQRDQTSGLGARTVALTGSGLLQSPYYSCLAAVLQNSFTEAGCRVLQFCCSQDAQPKNGAFAIDDFPGLRQAIENDEIQGVVHLDDFRPKALREFAAQQIPLFFVGAIGTSPNGLFFDFPSLIQDMVAGIPETQRSHTTLILPKVIMGYCKDAYTSMGCKAMEDTAPDHLDSLADTWIKHPAKMPANLLILDDLSGLRLLSRLAMNLPQDQIPPVTIMSNRQLTLSFPVRNITVFQLDFMDFTRTVVDHLMKTMRTQKLSTGKVLFRIPVLPL